MGPAAASLLFGDYPPGGRLPWQLPRSLDQVLKPGGTDVLADAVENWDIPYDLGATAAERADIRAKIDAGQPIDAAAMQAAGLFKNGRDGVRLLGNGEIKTKIEVKVAGASASAIAAVEKALRGRTCTLDELNDLYRKTGLRGAAPGPELVRVPPAGT